MSQNLYSLGPEDIERDDAVKAMVTTYRLYLRPDYGWGVEHELQMWFQNEWWWVARTDLYDDVCTGRVEPNWTLQDWIDHYKAKCAKSYGARLKRYKIGDFPTFAIIDQRTDG